MRKDALSKHRKEACRKRILDRSDNRSEETLDDANDPKVDDTFNSNDRVDGKLDSSNDDSRIDIDGGKIALKASNDSSDLENEDEDAMNDSNVSNGSSNAALRSLSASASGKETSDSDMVIKCQMCPFYVPYEFSVSCLKTLKQHHMTHAPPKGLRETLFCNGEFQIVLAEQQSARFYKLMKKV